MKILVVASFNSGQFSSFVTEQAESLKKNGVSVELFPIKGKGALGYLKNLIPLKKKISQGHYQLIHAHYGLSGLLALLQFNLPVICTFHGSDVHFKQYRVFSFLVSRLAVHNILTNIKQISLLKLKNRYSVIPCGIDMNLFQPMDRRACRQKLKLKEDRRYILFSSSFNNSVKNSRLAIEAVSNVENCELIELKGFSRQEVVELMNACDLLLVTSHYETGPLVVKEALACSTPVVSTDVGDVKQLISGLRNCYITSSNPIDVAEKIQQVLDSDRTCESRKVVEAFELQRVARSVKEVYLDALKDKGIKKRSTETNVSQDK